MKLIAGIQQVGIGVSDAHTSWAWYRKHFGMDVPVFEDEAEAALMTKYTGNKVYSRNAILAMNMSGGGGFEIWQYTNRTPVAAGFTPSLGDLGINAVKIKCRDIMEYYRYAKKEELNIVSDINGQSFYLRDLSGNLFQIKQAADWFQETKYLSGGVYGAVIGVSNMENAIKFYTKNLGYERVTGEKSWKVEGSEYQSVLLRHQNNACGAFSKLLGNTELELVVKTNGTARKIFENRYWGDLGFIHLCFDVNDMPKLKNNFELHGHHFTVDSADSFNMGEAAGRFAYVEDPDGTLIELVETHKIPIAKKFGIYLTLKPKHKTQALPNWQIKLLALARKKD